MQRILNLLCAFFMIQVIQAQATITQPKNSNNNLSVSQKFEKYYTIGVGHLKNQEYDNAEAVFQNIFNLVESNPELVNSRSIEFLSQTAYSLAASFQNNGNCKKSLKYHQLKLKYQSRVLSKNNADLIESVNDIGTSYECLEDYENAKGFYNWGMELSENGVNSKRINVITLKALLLINLGGLHNKLGEPQKSNELISIGEKILLDNKNDDSQIKYWVLMMLGTYYQDNGEPGKAKDIYNYMTNSLSLSGKYPDIIQNINKKLEQYDQL